MQANDLFDNLKIDIPTFIIILIVAFILAIIGFFIRSISIVNKYFKKFDKDIKKITDASHKLERNLEKQGLLFQKNLQVTLPLYMGASDDFLMQQEFNTDNLTYKEKQIYLSYLEEYKGLQEEFRSAVLKFHADLVEASSDRILFVRSIIKMKQKQFLKYTDFEKALKVMDNVKEETDNDNEDNNEEEIKTNSEDKNKTEGIKEDKLNEIEKEVDLALETKNDNAISNQEKNNED